MVFGILLSLRYKSFRFDVFRGVRGSLGLPIDTERGDEAVSIEPVPVSVVPDPDPSGTIAKQFPLKVCWYPSLDYFGIVEINAAFWDRFESALPGTISNLFPNFLRGRVFEL
jgi:hypothetical protein